MAEITMPQLGETVTEGTITRWLKQVGDQVAEDDVLFEVSTDKVDSEVPSPVSGYVSEILVDEGETVDVGTRLAVISDQAPSGGGSGRESGAQSNGQAAKGTTDRGRDVPDAASGDEWPAAAGAPSSDEGVAPRDEAAEVDDGDEEIEDEEAAEDEEADAGPQGAAAEPPGAAPGRPARAGPSASPPPERSTAPASPAASGGSGPGEKRPLVGAPGGSGGTRPASARPPSAPGAGGAGKVLSPVVRRLISEHNLDPGQIEGSGAGGRITRDDVLALIDRLGSQAPGTGDRPPTPEPPARPSPPPPAGRGADLPSPAGRGADSPSPSARGADSSLPATARSTAADPAAAPAPPPTATGHIVTPGQDDEVVPFTNIRRRTAEHMVRSKHTSAHTVVAVEVDYMAVDRVRTAQPEKLTYLPFIARAVIDAIAEWPHMNSSVGDDALIVHHHVNLGIAVDLNFEGLLVPVIHDAADRRLRALARDIASLAERARAKRLTMDDISGGTFTLTNAGPFGTLFTIPVINQPQIAIIATDGVRKKPVVVTAADGSDAIAIHPVGNLILSFDHRAVDGAYASAFMRTVRDSLEHRDWSSEL